jgi:putative ABC transport system permease protein
VRTTIDPLSLAAAIRAAVWDVDADQPVASVRSMREVLDAELTSRNTQMTLVGAFAALALLLASVGLYGLMAFAVVRRTSELGVRMALGAARGSVIAMVLREALLLVVAGLAIGVPAALLLGRVAANQVAGLLYGLTSTDPLTMGAAIVLLLAVAAGAAYFPAARAARINPIAALRAE